MILFHGFVFFLSLIGCHAIPVERNAECGYGSCNPVKDDMINVHLVPHTHDDVGWLKTVDQYYYGARNIIQNAGVQYVLDSVIQELAGDPSKRFIYVEIAFFARWWREQDESMQTLVKGLVNNGQLEFILGGWCMNDEASTHYNAIIDQHSLGFEFLRQNFGECGRPRIGWQIDPFGHSREQASLFAQFGFDGLYFGRLDYQDKDTRLNQTTMEMIWHGSPDNLGSKADLFTGVLPNLYQPPDGFCFDIFCDDEPIRDDPRLHDYNVDEKVYDFLSAVQDQAKHYKTNHIIMTMGSDFQYQNAHHWYKNMDKLIKYTNMMQTTNNMKVNVLYSTPSCYTYQLNRADKTWPTKKDDFFPYAHRDHSFWSGYFSSRAALKGYERETNTFLQACKQLDALAMLTDMHNSTLNIQVLREAMGVVQHHDGVSGTEKQEVAYDYAMRLANGRTACQKVMNDAFAKLIQKGSEGFMGVAFCDLLNISACEVTQNNKQFVMVVYNPVGRTVSRWLRLPVIGVAYTVMGPDNSPVQTQIVPITKRTMQIPERNGAIATNELVFKVSIPALGFSTYFIKMTNSKPNKEMQKSRMEKIQGKDFIMKNEHMALTLDGNNGKWKSLKDLHSGIEINVTNDMAVYYGMPGNCSRGDFQPSGAYIFRPNGTAPSGPSSALLIKGPLVTEVHTSFSSWATLVTRMYTGEPYTEVEWTVGPIPIDDNLGKEVVVRFMTDLKTNSMFYTDANGREIITRKRDYRETWTFNQTEPVAGNYAPVNSRIYIKDDNKGLQFTVLNDRSQGGSSIQDGEVELMVHRRTLYDDCLGVGEPMNETGSDHNGLIIRGKMFVHSGTTDTAAQFHRDFALRQYMAPLPMFAVTDMKYSDYSTYFRTMWSGLKQELPPNVHLLTLEQFGGPPIGPVDTQTYLIRLEHFYEKGEDAELSKPVSVNIQDLFVPFSIVGAEELTLGANLALSDLNRLQWQAEDQYVRDKEDKIYKVEKRVPLSSALDSVMLNPMEIRTFQVTLRGGFPQRKENKFDVFS